MPAGLGRDNISAVSTDPTPRQAGAARRVLRHIYDAGLRAVDPFSSVRSHLLLDGDMLHAGSGCWDLGRICEVHVIGAGKASAVMAAAVEDVLGDRVAGGLITTKYGHATHLARVRVREAGHPVPDDNGMQGAREIACIASRACERDLIICCLSGGGSALLPLPGHGLSLDHKQAVTVRRDK